MFITECPRDAMQGLPYLIPVHEKAAYINSLLKVGFNRIDFGSFVSPSAIPQMKDTHEVLKLLNLDGNTPDLLAIVGNTRGGLAAAGHPAIRFIGYPWSVSEGFLKLNINSDKVRSLQTIEKLLDICNGTGQNLIVYITMAFGNPYGDDWNFDILLEGIERLNSFGLKHISLSDTIGAAGPAQIRTAVGMALKHYPAVEFSIHLHTNLTQWYEKVDEAYKAGCRHFDGVLNGLGGCPMAGHKMVGNLNTNLLLLYCEQNGIHHGLDTEAIRNANEHAARIFQIA